MYLISYLHHTICPGGQGEDASFISDVTRKTSFQASDNQQVIICEIESTPYHIHLIDLVFFRCKRFFEVE